MIAVHILAILTCAVGVAFGRWLQGNGQRFFGYCCQGVFLAGAVSLGPLDGHHDHHWTILAAAAWMPVVILLGHIVGRTRWEDVPYSLLRYTTPPLVAILPWAILAGLYWALLAPVAIGLVQTAAYHLLAYKRPSWANVDANNDGEVDDVAAIPAGFIAGLAVGLL